MILLVVRLCNILFACCTILFTDIYLQIDEGTDYG